MNVLILGALLAQAQLPAEATTAPATLAEPIRGHMPGTFPPVPPGAALIRNSGSTNSAGYTLVIAPDGSATVRQDGGFTARSVAATQTRWLFARLHAAGPLDALGTERCMKSASFGTSTQIAWNGATSGDLSCASDAVSRELVRTIAAIAAQLAIDTHVRSHRLRPL